MASVVVDADSKNQRMHLKTTEVQTGSDIDVSSDSSSDDGQEENDETSYDTDSSDEEDFWKDEAESVSDSADSSDDDDDQLQGKSDTSSSESSFSSYEELLTTLTGWQRPSTANSDRETISTTPNEGPSVQTPQGREQTPSPQEQTIQSDVISTDSQTTSLQTNGSSSQTSPREEQPQTIQTEKTDPIKDADRQRQETITPSTPAPPDVDKSEMSGSTLASTHQTVHSEGTTIVTIPTRISSDDVEKTHEDLKSTETYSSVDSASAKRKTTSMNEVPTESQISTRQNIFREDENVQQLTNTVTSSRTPTRSVGIQTKPLLTPVYSPLRVTKDGGLSSYDQSQARTPSLVSSVPPKQPEPRTKKKLRHDQKRDLALVRRFVHPSKISAKHKKHPLQPESRDHKRNRPKREDFDAKKKRRPKSAPNDTILCTTRMKKDAKKGRGFSLAAFRLFFLDGS